MPFFPKSIVNYLAGYHNAINAVRSFWHILSSVDSEVGVEAAFRMNTFSDRCFEINDAKGCDQYSTRTGTGLDWFIYPSESQGIQELGCLFDTLWGMMHDTVLQLQDMMQDMMSCQYNNVMH
jgi:hypothetical protein